MDFLGGPTRIKLTSAAKATVSSGSYSDGSIYVEDPTRCSGVKLLGASGVSEGDNLTFTGSLGADLYSEPAISLVSIDSKTPGTAIGDTPEGVSR